MITSLETVANRLNEANVRFIIIGGWAAIINGVARSTNDVDVVYARDAENIRRLVIALHDWKPYLRGAPPGLPFRFDEATVRAGLNFTLTTSQGPIDLLGDVSGGGTYEELLPFTFEFVLGGHLTRVVELERLIQLKRAAGRARDQNDIAELQALLEERRKMEAGENE